MSAIDFHAAVKPCIAHAGTYIATLKPCSVENAQLLSKLDIKLLLFTAASPMLWCSLYYDN